MGSHFGGHLFTVHTGFKHLTKDFGHVCTGPTLSAPPRPSGRLALDARAAAPVVQADGNVILDVEFHRCAQK